MHWMVKYAYIMLLLSTALKMCFGTAKTIKTIEKRERKTHFANNIEKSQYRFIYKRPLLLVLVAVSLLSSTFIHFSSVGRHFICSSMWQKKCQFFTFCSLLENSRSKSLWAQRRPSEFSWRFLRSFNRLCADATDDESIVLLSKFILGPSRWPLTEPPFSLSPCTRFQFDFMIVFRQQCRRGTLIE